ncbi:MAG: hypothetical protein IV100_24580 [Myxococcales bacterium]|nr:hypothetical protein [Myxococcales bacterium]
MALGTASFTGDALMPPAGLGLLGAPVEVLDAVRRSFWRVATRLRLGRRCAADVDARLTAITAGHLTVSLTLTILFPAAMLLFGPLLLGAPHVLSDLRFLVARPLRHGSRAFRWQLGLVIVAVAVMVIGRTASLVGVRLPAAFDPVVGAAGVGLAALFGLVSRGLSLRTIGTTALAAGLFVVAWQAPRETQLTFAHGHNVVAIGTFVVLALKRRWFGVTGTLLVGVAAGVTVLGSGMLDESMLTTGRWDEPLLGLSVASLSTVLAPEWPGMWPFRIVMIYAFAQAVHYVCWLRLTPTALSPRTAPASFARSFRALRSDFGMAGLLVGLGLCMLVPALAALDAEQTRNTYLTLAGFHGWLELAVFALLLSRGDTALLGGKDAMAVGVEVAL